MYLIRVLLADDHVLLRTGLKMLLEAEPGIRVVGEAADGATGLRLARELAPDVAVIDLSMPDLDGAELIRRALAENPDLRVVGLSAGGAQAAARLQAAGAQGFVAKEAAFEQLADAVRAVALGHEFLSPETRRQLADRSDSGAAAALTPRERDVTRLMAEGFATKQIALELRVSIKTVETHRRRLMEKLGLDSVAELTKYAIRQGLTGVN